MPKLDKNYLWKLKIPLPPIEIQQKIVEILDAFTELQTELHARRKQYEYYRNKLLSQSELEKRTAKYKRKMDSSVKIDCHATATAESRNDRGLEACEFSSNDG